MKYCKYQALCARYPFLPHQLIWRGTDRGTKEFVRTKIGFIAFRPFETLDLSAKQSVIDTLLRPSGDYPVSTYTSTVYELSFHVADHDTTHGARRRIATVDVGDGSIQAHIDDLMQWFESCNVFKGKQLIWEHVLRRTIRGSTFAGMTCMNLEIFQFPQHYRFRQIEPKPNLPEDPVMTAYMNGGPMPPLIPGATA